MATMLVRTIKSPFKIKNESKMTDRPVYLYKIFHKLAMQYLQQELYSPCSNSTNDSTALAVKRK